MLNVFLYQTLAPSKFELYQIQRNIVRNAAQVRQMSDCRSLRIKFDIYVYRGSKVSHDVLNAQTNSRFLKQKNKTTLRYVG